MGLDARFSKRIATPIAWTLKSQRGDTSDSDQIKNIRKGSAIVLAIAFSVESLLTEFGSPATFLTVHLFERCTEHTGPPVASPVIGDENIQLFLYTCRAAGAVRCETYKANNICMVSFILRRSMDFRCDCPAATMGTMYTYSCSRITPT